MNSTRTNLSPELGSGSKLPRTTYLLTLCQAINLTAF